MSRVVPFVLLMALASSVQAQIFYEPVKYQYDAGGRAYYYGGSDPRVHILAREPVSSGGTWGRVNGFAFVGANRVVENEPERVFTDGLPYRNAHIYGMTPDDARNEAYANVPRYFAKRDVPLMAVRHGGTWVVPAQALPVRIYKSNGMELAPLPSTMPRPLMIIPKDAIQKRTSDKQLASTN